MFSLGFKQSSLPCAKTVKSKVFGTEHLKADLKNHSIRGGSIMLVAQAGQFALQMASTIILARLLTPEDFGLITMVMAITGFIAMFKDMGLSMATVQQAEINHDQISTLFWINVAIGLALMMVVAAVAPAIALFYEEPRLTPITLALSVVFVLGGLTMQHEALLRRQMRFGSLALIQITSLAVGIVTAIVSAWYGARYWALVLMQLAMAITGVIRTWSACKWFPSLPARLTGVRSMLAFGGNITGFNISNYFARKLDNVLIGRYCGSSALGLYSKAYQIVLLPLANLRSPLISVAIPALSQLQKDPVRYKNYYEKLLFLLSFISMPLVMFLFVSSESVISLLLTDKWIGMNNIFKILAIASFIEPVVGTRGLVFISLGQTRRYLRWGILSSMFIALSFIVGIRWGILGVATSYVIAKYLIFLPSLRYCFRFSHVSISNFFGAIWRSIIASIVMGIVMFYSLSLATGQTNLTKIILCFTIGLTMYLLMWLIMPGGVERLREICGYLPLIFSDGQKSKNNVQ